MSRIFEGARSCSADETTSVAPAAIGSMLEEPNDPWSKPLSAMPTRSGSRAPGAPRSAVELDWADIEIGGAVSRRTSRAELLRFTSARATPYRLGDRVDAESSAPCRSVVDVSVICILEAGEWASAVSGRARCPACAPRGGSPAQAFLEASASRSESATSASALDEVPTDPVGRVDTERLSN